MRLGSTFGKDPELGVDEGSGSGRIPESLLQWGWDGHGRIREMFEVRGETRSSRDGVRRGSPVVAGGFLHLRDALPFANPLLYTYI